MLPGWLKLRRYRWPVSFGRGREESDLPPRVVPHPMLVPAPVAGPPESGPLGILRNRGRFGVGMKWPPQPKWPGERSPQATVGSDGIVLAPPLLDHARSAWASSTSRRSPRCDRQLVA